MGRFLPLLLVACSVTGPVASAHQVDQLYSEFSSSEGDWSLLLYFDAGFALPEMRNDPAAPAPERQWLVELDTEAHERLRREADSYLQDALVLKMDGEPLAWDVRFPDWESDPPDFPVLRNGGAYFRMAFGRPWPPTGGTLSCTLAEGDFPRLVIGVGGNRFLTLRPGQSETLAVVRRSGTLPPTSTPAPSPTGGSRREVLALILFAVVIVTLLAARRFGRRTRL